MIINILIEIEVLVWSFVSSHSNGICALSIDYAASGVEGESVAIGRSGREEAGLLVTLTRAPSRDSILAAAVEVVVESERGWSADWDLGCDCAGDGCGS